MNFLQWLKEKVKDNDSITVKDESLIPIIKQMLEKREETMKMLYCPDCNDIFNLSRNTKSCTCNKVGGRYLDDVIAEYWGHNAIPLGFTNNSFKEALIKQPNDGLGSRYESFIIAKNCNTMKKVR